jgi:hypothetical protein
MPYDPNLPQAGTEIDAVQMRAQLTGLKDLIDAVPQITGAVVDAVNSTDPGTPAVVTVSVSGSVLHFAFDIPQGSEGIPGQPGSTGSSGSTGPEGPPFTNFVVDGVTTLDPGEPATVTANFNGSAVQLSFGIPRGSEGSEGAPGPPFASAVVDGVTTLDPNEPASVDSTFDGTTVHFTFGIPRGADGNQGAEGSQGQPGEVTLQQLADEIANTSNNVNHVTPLGLAVSDPPTQAEVQQLADKLDELINALWR